MATREEIIRLLFKSDDAALGESAKELDNLGKTAGANEKKLDEFADELDRLGKADTALRGITAARARLSELGPALVQARERLVGLQIEFNQADKPSRKLSNELERARKTVQGLTAEQNRLTASITPNTNALQKLGVDTKNADAAQRQLRQSSADLRTRIAAYAESAKTAAKASGDLSRDVRTAGQNAKTAAADFGEVQIGLGKIAAAATAAVAAVKGLSFGATLIGEAARLQQGFAEVAAVAGGTAENLGQLRVAAEQAAMATGTSVDDITAGLSDLARTGLSTEQAIAALGPALDLSLDKGLGLANSVEILTTTLSQFQFGAEQSARVADVLAHAANATNSSVEGLGRSLTDVAPLANQLGISFEDTVAILGKMADAGFRGSRAGTALRAVFSQLLDPASKFRSALDALGIKGNDFAGILEQLAQAGEAGKAAFLELDTEARPAIMALAQQGSPAVRKLAEELKNAEGAAAQVAAVVRNTLGTAFARLSNTAGLAATGLLDGLLKPLQRTLENVQQRLQAFAASPEFDQLKQRLATTFGDGLEAVNQFLAAMDFDDVLVSIDKLARGTSDLFSGLRENSQETAAAINKISAAFNWIVSVADAANYALDELNQKSARYGAETRRVALLTAGLVSDQSQALSVVARQITELENLEATASTRRARAWADANRSAVEYRGELANVADASSVLSELASDAIGPISGVVENLVGRLGDVWRKTQEEARKTIEILPEIIPTATAATESVTKIGEAGAQSARVLRERFEKELDDLRPQINLMKLEVAEAFAAGADAKPLQAKLDSLEQRFRDTSVQAQNLGDVLSSLDKSGGDSLRSTGRSAVAAAEGVQTLNQQVAETAQSVSKASGALDALNAKFREARAQAEALGADALEAFDRVNTFSGIIRTTGRGTADVLQLIADRSKNAAEFVDEMARTMGSAEDRARRTADAMRRVQEEAKASAQALQALEDAYRQAQDEADRRAGNDEAIRKRAYEQELARIAQLEAEAGASGAARANELRRLAREVFEDDLRLIREREREQIDSDQRIDDSRRRRSGGSGGAGLVDRTPTTTIREITPVVINVNAEQFGNVEDLARKIAPQLDRLQRSGFNQRLGR